MRFRLVYDGTLHSSQGEARNGQPVGRANEKQEIRKAFHKQLRELWRTNTFLSEHKVYNNTQIAIPIERNVGGVFGYGGRQPPGSERSLADFVADQHPQLSGYRFVPLVREAWTLACGLEILFLRHDPPGSVYAAGDIDNRIKTLLDGLRMPKSVQELGGYTIADVDESPFFCLLEDDKCITTLSVETDTLLTQAVAADHSWAHVVVTVDVHPYMVTTFNLGLA